MINAPSTDEEKRVIARQKQREWRKANRDKVRSYKRAHYKKHRLQVRAKQQEKYVERRTETLARKRKFYQENREAFRAKQNAYRAPKQHSLNLKQRESRAANRSRFLYYSAKKTAKIRGVEFDLTRDWFENRISAGVCEMSGMPFNFVVKRGPDSPSVDRIMPGGPYTQANCRLVLWALNRALNNYGEDYMINVFKSVIARREGK